MIQMLFFEGVRRGYYRSCYYGDAVLYAVGTAILCHGVSYLLKEFYLSLSWWS